MTGVENDIRMIFAGLSILQAGVWIAENWLLAGIPPNFPCVLGH
jgi:hypothetical protein